MNDITTSPGAPPPAAALEEARRAGPLATAALPSGLRLPLAAAPLASLAACAGADSSAAENADAAVASDTDVQAAEREAKSLRSRVSGQTTAGWLVHAPLAIEGLSDEQIARFLGWAGFGASPFKGAKPEQSIADVRRFETIQGWFAHQRDLARKEDAFVEQITAKTLCAPVPHPRGGFTNARWRYTEVLDQLVAHRWAHSSAVLSVRMTHALSNILVASVEGLPTSWRSFAMARYHDILATHAFGNYRRLLREMTLSAAMGLYLNLSDSSKARDNIEPDENFARELLQLFTIGLNQIDPATGAPQENAPTYTNEDVLALARLLTGWRQDTSADPRRPPTCDEWAWRLMRPMVSVKALHDEDPKTLLGTAIPGGQSAEKDLDAALDIVFEHPNTPYFIARLLIQRFVTSNPSSNYVRRVAQVFIDNGRQERGDLFAVLQAILIHPLRVAHEHRKEAEPFGRLREHFISTMQIGRTLQFWSNRRGNHDLNSYPDKPFHAPSVFNFFRPGYRVPAGHAERGDWVAPEFQRLDEAKLLWHTKTLMRLLKGTDWSYVIEYDRLKVTVGKSDHWAHMLAGRDEDGPNGAPGLPYLLDRIDLTMTGRRLSAASRQDILAAVRAMPAGNNLENHCNRLRTLILLVVLSPEYRIQH